MSIYTKLYIIITTGLPVVMINADFPDDNSGALPINLAISRTELKSLPKQRRKINKRGVFGENYLISYQIIR